MNVVSDTNIFLAVVLDEPEKENIIQLTSEIRAISPEILPYEVGNALSAMVKQKRLKCHEAALAFEAVKAISVRLIAVDISQALKLAFEHDIYAYDAYFLQCARQLSCPLLTLDKRMKRVAHDIDVEVLELEP